MKVRHLGGALAKPSDALVGHRSAAFALQVLSGLDRDNGDAVGETHRRVLDTQRSRGTFLNNHYGPATAEQVRAAYEPEVYRRLTELKRRYDPANMFRFNHKIPPAG
ncbi:Berberine and berberine like [Sinosporangium album]|uniref:Berberine and berberine like n=1 Tax=Sinosporangium album TaxID=504805 RepID=A0A1G8DES1_9ACTN|nr:BBE domain-containing protein [Sinosporangium album]SDH56143.1 Berberine and berberine like [Sinosporangium album]